jgi:hypothetical protein
VLRAGLFVVLFLSLLSSGENYYKEGKKVYDKLCIGCHQLTIPAEKGPSLQMVVNRLKIMTRSKSMSPYFQRGVILGYIRNYTLHPKMMRGASQGLEFSQYKEMPSIKGKLTKEELNAAAIWLYDNFIVTKPKEFEEIAKDMSIGDSALEESEESGIWSLFTLQDIIVAISLLFIALIFAYAANRRDEKDER